MRVEFDPAARTEFLDAIRYYEREREGLGGRFRDAIYAALKRVVATPERFRQIRPPFRRCLVQRFPYFLVYTIEPDHIHVLAVAHQRRRPDYWADRS
jgi:plasmid stabilization system protein ParE